MMEENEHRMTIQLLLLLLFWGPAVFTFITQMYHLPSELNTTIIRDPYTYFPLEYNPYNMRMTLIESCIIWLGFFYGLLRIFNIFRIIVEDEEENKWIYFWDRLEK